MNSDSARERRVRRLLATEGLYLRRSRIRDPHNHHVNDWGGYRVIDQANIIQAGENFSLGLDDLEAWFV